MEFTKEQLSELICKHTEKENGLQDLMEIMLESLMVSERREYLQEEGLAGNKCNGYRPGRTYGHGRTLTFRIPRDRYGNFHPRILAILRDQEEECERLAGTLYTKGLTQEQVGEVFADIYGEHYSKASISRMLDYLRKDVTEWLERSLEIYYPVVFIDCVHIKIHRKRSVDTEAFYVVLAVKEDKTREVLGIFNKPTESALGWGEMLNDLQERGVGKIGLICADGLRGLEDVISEVFPGTKLQRCTTHLKRNIISAQRRQGGCRRRSAAGVPYRGQELYCGAGMERVAGVLLQMGQVLQEHPQARRGRLLQGVFHIPELRPPHPVDDIHHELDRAAAEGLPEGHEDARRNAQRGVRHPAHGKDGHGQEVIPEAGAQNRS